jgi:hypothetical protein
MQFDHSLGFGHAGSPYGERLAGRDIGLAAVEVCFVVDDDPGDTRPLAIVGDDNADQRQIGQ